ncbi:septin GTPase [Chlorella sorokiniana]|uniref:Septin GTPase n=1 Tax=Chlorella sorokiniana TaxID=3076 RepID=A0A2P6TYM4_CHLSO|nr:septin GTPase [Chlorella sorokiniana]|eukprot:PRW59161.1 septin GTPase [Chlorella sorokiniana]
MDSADDRSPKSYLAAHGPELDLPGPRKGAGLWAPPSRGAGAGGVGGGVSGFRAASQATTDRSTSAGGLATYGGPPPSAREAYGSQPGSARNGPTHAQEPFTPAGAPLQATAVVEGSMRSPDEAKAELRELDVRSASAALPRIKPHWSHRYMKILLVGESGLGKTTFIRNLFAAYARDASFPINDAGGPNARRVFAENPEALCTEIVLQDSEHKVYYHYLVQDTPGYGDSTDLAGDRRLVLDYIDVSSSTYLLQASRLPSFFIETDPERRAAMAAIRDTRVDVCLYFVPPHRLRQIDLQFICELAAVLPVVPVLAKADTMTSEELKASGREFRHRVRSSLGKAGVASPFSRDALEDAGARHGPPFAVVCSGQMDLEVGSAGQRRFWPVRKYPWGSVEAMLTQHSDLPVLRRLLFEAGYYELKEGTEARFHEYRHTVCSGASSGGLKGTLAGLARMALLTGGALLAGWLMTRGVPLLKDEVKRRETVRRVKEKASGVVDTVVDAARDAGSKAQTAAAVAKTTTEVVVDQAKRNARGTFGKAGRVLETDEQRKRREAAEKQQELDQKKPWWKPWGSGE